MTGHSEDFHYNGPFFAPVKLAGVPNATHHRLTIRADGRASSSIYTQEGHRITPGACETFTLVTPITVAAALELLWRTGGDDRARMTFNQLFGFEFEWESV
jgi:hypothetical protein